MCCRGTGILMNNGVMWFDPRPGRPNSMAPGKRALTNMCPVVALRDGRAWFGVGASGGRRILGRGLADGELRRRFRHGPARRRRTIRASTRAAASGSASTAGCRRRSPKRSLASRRRPGRARHLPDPVCLPEHGIARRRRYQSRHLRRDVAVVGPSPNPIRTGGYWEPAQRSPQSIPIIVQCVRKFVIPGRRAAASPEPMHISLDRERVRRQRVLVALRVHAFRAAAVPAPE